LIGVGSFSIVGVASHTMLQFVSRTITIALLAIGGAIKSCAAQAAQAIDDGALYILRLAAR
jgi:hypothetical protein